MKPLFLLVHVKAEHVAGVRARAAYELYTALKSEASSENIVFNTTTFASLCGLKCDVFSKVMGRVKSLPVRCRPTSGLLHPPSVPGELRLVPEVGRK